jgi:hypothetical protein
MRPAPPARPVAPRWRGGRARLLALGLGTMPARLAALPLWAVLSSGVAPPAVAQEFAAPAAAGPGGVATLLEWALPDTSEGASLAILSTRWFGLPEMVTNSVAAGGSWRSARFAIGLSHSGDSDLGWSAVGVAGGWAGPVAGAGLRVCARGYPAASGSATAPGGIECGAGAWALAAPHVGLWASAPQIWNAGEAPPLERWLELGASLSTPGIQCWLVRAAAPGAGGGVRAEHAFGVSSRGGPVAAWAELRDRPPRGALGLGAWTRLAGVAARVESHPVLGETVRLGLVVGARGR